MEENEVKNEQNESFVDQVKNVMEDVEDNSSSFGKDEAEKGKVMGILSYIGILSLIPFFAEKENKYVIYHAKQGVNLFIIQVIVGFVLGILGKLPLVGGIFGLISSIIGLLFLILSIIGIVNVCKGKAKELPLVGKIKIVK